MYKSLIKCSPDSFDDNNLYVFVIQSKTDLNKSMQINFFGYESQDEVVEVLSSLKIK